MSSSLRDLRRMVAQFDHLPPETPVNVVTLVGGPTTCYRLVSLEVASQPGHADELRILAASFNSAAGR